MRRASRRERSPSRPSRVWVGAAPMPRAEIRRRSGEAVWGLATETDARHGAVGSMFMRHRRFPAGRARWTHAATGAGHHCRRRGAASAGDGRQRRTDYLDSADAPAGLVCEAAGSSGGFRMAAPPLDRQRQLFCAPAFIHSLMTSISAAVRNGASSGMRSPTMPARAVELVDQIAVLCIVRRHPVERHLGAGHVHEIREGQTHREIETGLGFVRTVVHDATRGEHEALDARQRGHQRISRRRRRRRRRGDGGITPASGDTHHE